MGIKWRNKILRLSVMLLAFLLSINPLELSSIIRANEEIGNGQFYIEKNLSNDNIDAVNNIENGNGSIDMRQLFNFSGMSRNNSDLRIIKDINSTASFLTNNNIYNSENIAKIGTVSNIDGLKDRHKQSILATSNIPVNLNRDFEIEGSFSMKNMAHGFVFALHNQNNYIPQGTDDSLGVYYDPDRKNITLGGLKNAFIMEVDTYVGDKLFGDNYINNKHIAYTETSHTGEFKYNRNTWIGNLMYHKTIDNSDLNNLFTLKSNPGSNEHVRFVMSWDASTRQIEVKFVDQKLSKYNLTPRVSNNLWKLQENGGNAYVSIGGTTDWAGRDFMEVGIHRIKYNDLEPGVHTYFYDENEKKEIESVYPGQKITVRHQFYNKKYVPVDIHDGLRLNMLYLQFLNQKQIEGTIHPGKNLEPYDINVWKVGDQNQEYDKIRYDYFNTKNPIPITFPKNGKYFVVEYKIEVPNSVDIPENYAKEFYLYFLTSIGIKGFSGIQLTDKHMVRLNPKIESRKSNTEIVRKHEVFQYTGPYYDDTVKKVDIIHQLWEELYVTSTGDRNIKLSTGATQTPGTIINSNYLLTENDNVKKVSKDNLPNRIGKANSVTLQLEVIDRVNNNLKSYYYRTIVIGDRYKLSDDGNYLIYGRHIGNVKDTVINTMDQNNFIRYIKENSQVKVLKRLSYDATVELSEFVLANSDVSVNQNWIVNGKIDIKSNTDLSAKTENIMLKSTDNSQTFINLNLIIESNAISIDDGKNNLANGITGYVIIPSLIEVHDDVSNPEKISGMGRIYLSDYSTNKSFHVWVDKIVNLISTDGDRVELASKRLDGNPNGPSIGNDIEYLGLVNKSVKKDKPLKFELSGSKFKGDSKEFNGAIKFYIRLES